MIVGVDVIVVVVNHAHVVVDDEVVPCLSL